MGKADISERIKDFIYRHLPSNLFQTKREKISFIREMPLKLAELFL
jgi:hypothetical protein